MSNEYGIPECPIESYISDDVEHEGDATVISDMHMPNHSEAWTVRAFQKSREFGIRTLIMAGDMFEMSYLSRFRKRKVREIQSDLNKDFPMGRQFFDAVFNNFDKAYIIRGNHDDRYMQALDDSVSFETFLHMIVREKHWNRLKAVEMPYMLLTSGYDTYRITHPKSYSKAALSVANKIAMTKRQHVLMAHGHRFNVGRSEDNMFTVVDTGGLFDETTIQYRYELGDTTYPEWVNGFVIVKDGILYPFSEGIGL